MDKRYVLSLEESKLWDHVLGLAVAPPALIAKTNNTEERSETVYQRSLKIKDFTDNARRTMAKIGRMCTETVQKEFLSQKDFASWTLKVLWDYLQKRYTLQN